MLITDRYKQLRNEILSLDSEVKRVNEAIQSGCDSYKESAKADLLVTNIAESIQESATKLQYIIDLQVHKAQLIERILICIAKLKELDNMIEYSEMLEDCLSLEVQR